MTVRELLQIELWSKRTSRKILVGLGSVFGVLVVGLGISFAIEMYWLTPGERRAARLAFVQIDAMQNLDSISDQDFDARKKQAERKVETAHQAAWTVRDDRVYQALGAYLVMIEMDRTSAQMRKRLDQRHIAIKDSDLQFDEKLDRQGFEVTKFLRSALHKALD